MSSATRANTIIADDGTDYTKISKTDADVKMRSAIPGLQSVTFKTRAGVFEEVMPDVTLAQNEIFIKITQNLIEVNIDVAQ